jgi:hypothetical protein
LSLFVLVAFLALTANITHILESSCSEIPSRRQVSSQYPRDLHADDSHGFDTSSADQLVKYTTPLERQTIVELIRKALADEEKDWRLTAPGVWQILAGPAGRVATTPDLFN